MRVLLVVDDLSDPPSRAMLCKLVGLFDLRRIQVIVCALRTPPDDLSLQIDVSLKRKRRFDLGTVAQIVHLIHDYHVELIHVVEPRAAGVAGLAGRRTGIPVLHSRYDVDWNVERNFVGTLVRRWGWKALLLLVDRLIVSADVLRRDFSFVMGQPTTPTETVYTGFAVPDLAALPPREALGLPDGPLMAMFPTLEHDAGYEIIFDVLHRLLKRLPNVSLAVVGNNAAVIELQRKAANIRPALPIRWLGGEVDPWAVLNACNVLIECQTRDRIPDSLMMAALAGKPVIANRLPAISEVVESSITGILVTTGDASDLAAQATRVLLHEGVARRLGTTAERKAKERFSLEALRQAMTELYEARVYSTR